MSNIQQVPTLNLFVPVNGITDVTAIGLPQGTVFLPDGYTIDWRSLGQIVPGQTMIPQACTVDASDLPNTVTITFLILSIGFRRKIIGGTTPTFQFPAVQDLVTQLLPSDGTSQFNCFFYNYPALPDCGCGS